MRITEIPDLKKLILNVTLRSVSGLFIMGLILFLPAGSLAYWNAWIYLVIVFTILGVAFIYLIGKDPALLNRRLRTREKEEPQKLIIMTNTIIFIASFMTAGFDFRYKWSHVSGWLVIISYIIMIVGFLIFFKVLKTNSFASRIIEVEMGQKVIDSGPYAIVRHPMYSAVLMIYLFGPLALGSWWSFILLLPVPVLLRSRIYNEEKLLKHELPGYEDYMRKVKYRMIPFIW
jgi:protein-S-isoprenylcysteine O-methyltransferase Ste14